MSNTRSMLMALSFALAAVTAPAQLAETYTFTTNRLVPDGNPAGLGDVRSIGSAIATISSVAVRLRIDGEFNGDLYAYLRHGSGLAVLLNRPGRTASRAAGYDDSGVDVTFRSGAANGDIHLYRTVATPAAGLPVTGTWEPDGRAADPSVVTETNSRTALLTSFAGLSAAGEWTLYLVDAQSGGTNMLREWSLEITGTSGPALAWAKPAAITYGTALGSSQLNATALFASTNVIGTFAYTPPLGTILNAGTGQTLSVTFTPADSAAFQAVTTNVLLDVLPASLTVAANSESKVYGVALPTLTASYSGFVNGDTVASLDTPVTLTTTATAGSDVGTYSVTASQAADANYAITFVAGTLTITQALTSASLTTSANPALPGSAVTFTMTLSSLGGAPAPAGMVNFRVDGAVIGSTAITGGAAAFTTSGLSVGPHVVVAEYATGQNYAGATNRLSPDEVINTPPVAVADTIQRYPYDATKVRLSTLLANDSDADGDALTPAVSAASTQGGTVTVSNGWVYYTPRAGFTNVDTFTYTIADGRGGSATATVTVAITADAGPGENLAITDLGGGSVRLKGSGVPGRTYRLQYAAALNPGAWQDLPGGSVTADATGAFEFIDSGVSGTRYYRSAYP